MVQNTLPLPVKTEILNPSTLEIYQILVNQKLKVTDIKNLTHYNPRTIRLALKKLTEFDLIIKIPDIYDMRSHYYTAIGLLVS